MQFDGLKTCFIGGIPSLPREDINKALLNIGPQTLFTIKDERSPKYNRLFCQFRTAAQIKVALEILPQIKISSSDEQVSVVVSQETLDWIQRAAATASAVSVTRMPAAALIAKIQSQLETALRARDENQENKADVLEPDGTLTTEFPPDQLERLQRDVLEFRKETFRLQNDQESRRIGLIKQFRDKITKEDEVLVQEEDPEFANFDEAQVLSLPSPSPELSWDDFVANTRRRIEDIKEKQEALKDEEKKRAENAVQEMERLKTYNEASFPGDLRSLQIKCAKEREADERIALEAPDSPFEELEEASEPESNDIVWSKITDEWIEMTLKPEVNKKLTEIFGESDDSLVEFVVDLVKAETPAENLAGELQAPLDEDADQFADMLINLLKGA